MNTKCVCFSVCEAERVRESEREEETIKERKTLHFSTLSISFPEKYVASTDSTNQRTTVHLPYLTHTHIHTQCICISMYL